MFLTGEVKCLRHVSRSESESEKGVESDGTDAKPSDLPLTRVKAPSQALEARTSFR